MDEEEKKILTPEAIKFYAKNNALNEYMSTLSDDELSTAMDNIYIDIINSLGIQRDMMKELCDRNATLFQEESNKTNMSK